MRTPGRRDRRSLFAPRGRDLDIPGRKEAAKNIHIGIDWLFSRLQMPRRTASAKKQTSLIANLPDYER